MIALDEPWDVAGTSFSAGSLVCGDLAAASADPEHLQPVLVYAPGPRETLGSVVATRDRLIVTTYQNVKGRAVLYAPEAHGGWSHEPLALPDDSSIEAGATDRTWPVAPEATFSNSPIAASITIRLLEP